VLGPPGASRSCFPSRRPRAWPPRGLALLLPVPPPSRSAPARFAPFTFGARSPPGPRAPASRPAALALGPRSLAPLIVGARSPPALIPALTLLTSSSGCSARARFAPFTFGARSPPGPRAPASRPAALALGPRSLAPFTFGARSLPALTLRSSSSGCCPEARSRRSPSALPHPPPSFSARRVRAALYREARAQRSRIAPGRRSLHPSATIPAHRAFPCRAQRRSARFPPPAREHPARYSPLSENLKFFSTNCTIGCGHDS
jgi:hypothetical protein